MESMPATGQSVAYPLGVRILTVIVVLLALVIGVLTTLNRSAAPLPGPGPLDREPSAQGTSPSAELSPTHEQLSTGTESQRASIEGEPEGMGAGSIRPHGELTANLRVRDDRNRPIELVLFNGFHMPELTGEGQQPAPLRLSRSLGNRDGHFKVQGLCPGEWTLILEAPSMGWSRGQGRKIVKVAMPQTERWIDVTLERPASVAGQVVNNQGQALEGARVSGPGSLQTWTDEWGAFSFETMPAGSITLKASLSASATEQPLTLIPGEERRDIVLRFPGAGTILGEVVDTQGQRVPSMDVVLIGSDDRMSDSTRSDDQGRFRFSPVEPGNYSLVAAHMDLMLDSEPSFFEKLTTQAIQVEPEQTHEVVLYMKEVRSSVEVHGQITSDGEPIAHTNILVVAEGGSFLETTRSVTTGEQGEYSIQLAGPGPVVFFISRTREQPIAVVDVPDVSSYLCDITLPTGNLKVIIPNESADVEVSLHALSGFQSRPGAALEREWAQRGAGKVQSLEFSQLLPGHYMVQGHAFDAVSRTIQSSPIEVRNGRSETVELTLLSPCTLTGTTLNAKGDPTAGVIVQALATESGQPLDRTRSDRRGHYTLGPLPVGKITLQGGVGSDCLLSFEEIAEGDVLERDLTLKPGSHVHVRIMDTSGTARGAHLSLRTPAGQRVDGWTGQGDSGKSRSGLNAPLQLSTRSFGPLPPGAYALTAHWGTAESKTRSVQVRANEATEIRWTLD